MAKAEAAIRTGLPNVLEQDSYDIALQPIVRLEDGGILGYEAFVRAPVPYDRPQVLLDAALKSGCLLDLEAGICAKSARAVLDLCDGAKLFVNLTPEGFCGGFLRCSRALRTLPPERVVVELTEAFPYDERIRAAAESWRAAGYALAVDDMASGFSRLMAVAMVRPHYLKIDRDVVQNAADPAWRAVIKSVKALGYEIGAQVIAEGVETQDDARGLIDLGIEYAQGYFFGRPFLCLTEGAPAAHQALTSRSGRA